MFSISIFCGNLLAPQLVSVGQDLRQTLGQTTISSPWWEGLSCPHRAALLSALTLKPLDLLSQSERQTPTLLLEWTWVSQHAIISLQIPSAASKHPTPLSSSWKHRYLIWFCSPIWKIGNGWWAAVWLGHVEPQTELLAVVGEQKKEGRAKWTKMVMGFSLPTNAKINLRQTQSWVGSKKGSHIRKWGELDNLGDSYSPDYSRTWTHRKYQRKAGSPIWLETTRRRQFLQIKPLKVTTQQILSPMEKGVGR